MGFIDWHGNKEDHYEDVVDYARQCQEEEKRCIEEKQVRKWFGNELGNPGFMNVEPRDLMKYMLRETQILKNCFDHMEFKKEKGVSLIPEQLWADSWIYTIDFWTTFFLPDEKKEKFVQSLSEKMFHVESIQAELFYRNFPGKNHRYENYIRNSFELSRFSEKNFWKYLYKYGKQDQVQKYIEAYIEFISFLVYYLYLSVEVPRNGKAWQNNLLSCKEELNEVRKKGLRVNTQNLNLRELINPIYRRTDTEYVQQLLHSMRILPFRLTAGFHDREGEFKMIEELYMQLQENEISFSDLDSIVPQNVRADILNGILPEFSKPDLTDLQSEEKIHYINHTVLYQGRDTDEGIRFYDYKGILYFTDKRVVFNGNGKVSLPYEKIDRVIEYDLIPEILEFRSGSKTSFFQIPDTETAYKVLKLIANHGRGKAAAKVEAPYTYEELVDKADIKACMFAFDYVVSGDMPQEFRDMLTELNRKLQGLQKTIERYPERQEEIYQFLHYYIPEAVRLVVSYQRYQNVGLEIQTINKVYEKVKSAVAALDMAVYQKISDIYHLETMDTVAGAEALKEILGQDGYVDPAYEMKNSRRY